MRARGQKVNEAKTRVYFSANVPSQVKEELSQALGFQKTEDMGKYLRIPIQGCARCKAN